MTTAKITVTESEALKLSVACQLRAQACLENGESAQARIWYGLSSKCQQARLRIRRASARKNRART